MARWTASNSEGYESPAGLASDVVVLTVRRGALCLLVTAHEERLRLPGGFVLPHERPGDAALRHLQRLTGIDQHYLEQLGAYGTPDRDDRGWVPAVAYVALVPPWTRPTCDRSGWHEVAELPTLAFDHQAMLLDGLDRVRGKLWWSNVAVGILPDAFTMSDARDVYQAITRLRYDASTFARDLRSTGLVEPVGEKRALGPGRPAALYRFVSRDLVWGAGRRKRVRVASPQPGPGGGPADPA